MTWLIFTEKGMQVGQILRYGYCLKIKEYTKLNKKILLNILVISIQYDDSQGTNLKY